MMEVLSALFHLKQKMSDDIRSCPDGDLRDIMECQLMLLENEELTDEVEAALADIDTGAVAVTDAYTAYAQCIFGDMVHGLFAFRAEDLICLGQMISGLMQQEPSCSDAEDKIVFCDHVRLSHVLLQPNIAGIAERAHIVSPTPPKGTLRYRVFMQSPPSKGKGLYWTSVGAG